MADDFSDLKKLYGRNDEDDLQATQFDQIDQLYNQAGVNTDAANIPVSEPKPIDKQADELGSQYFRGMSFEDAINEYERIRNLPNTEVERFSGNLVYTDNVTGRREFVPRPSPKMFSGLVETAISALPESVEKYPAKVANFLGLEVNEDAQADAFSNPKAGVSGIQLAEMGLRESVGDAAQTVAALAGNDKMVEDIDAATPRIDTDDSFYDSAIADGLPAVAASVVGDKGVGLARTVLSKIPLIGKVTPNAVKNLARLGVDEAAAVATLGTEEGNLFIGEDSAIPLWKGVDLGDSASDQVLNQRINALAEGLMGTSFIAGAGRSGADVGRLAYDILARPIYNAVGPKAGKEQIVFNDIVDQIVGDSVDLSDPQQRFQAIEAIARIADQNSEILIPHLDNLAEADPVQLDTLNAILRGSVSREEAINLRKLIAEAQTKARPKFLSKASEAKDRLDDEVASYLDSLDAETDAQQVSAMQGATNELTESANQYVDTANTNAVAAEQRYLESLESIGSGISEDLEFAPRLKKLEEITGTEIAVDKDAKLGEIMDGIRLGYEDLKTQKDLLYADIEGGEIDIDGIFKEINDLNDDQISAAASQVRRSSPLNNMLAVINTKTIRDVDPVTGEEIVRAPTDEERLELFRDFLTEQGADYGYFYTTLRPELSALAADLFENDATKGAGRIIRDMVKYIDDDMTDFVAQSDEELADAARAAKAFYQDKFAPIFGGEGVMADYAALHNRTVGRTNAADVSGARTFDQAGYDQGVQRLSNRVFSGGVPAEASQMFAALEVASDPNAMADYMILDVMNNYATQIRMEGLNNANLTSMSADLQRYATQLNELFPKKAEQLNKFVRQIETAAKNKGDLENILGQVDAKVKSAKDDVAQTALNFFLVDEAFDTGYIPSSNPQASFSKLFNSEQSVLNVQNINSQIDALPPGKQEIVRRGLEVAYAREFQLKLSDFRQEVGGGTPLKETALAKAQREFTQLFAVGRQVFANTPEVMEALEMYADVAGAVQRNRNVRSNVTNSNTAFLQEATSATNRMIFSFIGPLSRAGTRVRAGASAILERVNPDGISAEIRDRILSDPQYFAQLARRYNQAPRDMEAEDMLKRFLIGATIKVRSATDEEDTPMTVDGALTGAVNAIDSVAAPVSTGLDYLDQQMNGVLQ